MLFAALSNMGNVVPGRVVPFGNTRFFCTQCTGDGSGCSDTQYCLHLNMMVTPGCCRDKQASGGFCVPRRNGVDCTSGTCNNIIPSNINLFGVTLPFNTLNQWIGTCA